MKKIIYILIFLLTATTSYSQKNDYNVWVIGYNLTLDFNTPDGSPILTKDFTLDEDEFDLNFYSSDYTGNGHHIYDATTLGVVSNKLGELVYFALGNMVYNEYNFLQEPRDNYLGGKLYNVKKHPYDNTRYRFSSYFANQSNIIFRYDSKYIRVINNNLEFYNYSDRTIPPEYVKLEPKLAYDIFDDNLNRIEESRIAYEHIESLAMCAIKKMGTENYWIILYDNIKNYYYSFELSEDGIISEYSDRYYSEKPDSLWSSRIKASTNGQLIANVINDERNSEDEKSYNEILKFDPYKGKFIKTIAKIKSRNILDIEFSTNNRYLYYLNYSLGKNELNQFDLYEMSENNIYHNNTIYMKSLMQLGPDKNIYLTKNTDESQRNFTGNHPIFKIEHSNRGEIARIKTHIPGGVLDSVTTVAFPNIPASYYLDLYTDFDKEVCPGDSVQLRADLLVEHDSATYSWAGPNNYNSTEQNPVIENANQSHAGLYTVTVKTDTDTYTAETFVRVKPSPKPAIRAYPKAFLCEKGEVTLSLIDEHESYLWSTGDTTKFIVVEESGKYGVTVENDLGCTGFVEIQVGFGDEYQLAITGDTIKCEGESVTLTSTEEYPNYRWSNGADTRSITVVDPANFTLTVTTEDGCEIKRTIEVKDHPNVLTELKPVPTTICEGDSVLLESKYDADYFEYQWSTDETTKSIYASETGTYKLTITDTRTGCMDSTEIAISVEDNLQPTIIGSDICEGETAILEALPNDPSYSYEWSNGETTPTIQVTEAGTYSVTVSKDGCTGTADFTVNESPNPEFEILGEDIVCGNTATLTSDNDFAEYLWSTNEVTKDIEVTEPGTYSLTVTDANGCQATEEFTVKEQALSFDISKDRIDFGKMYISETRRDSVEIINTSGIDIDLANGQIVNDGMPIIFKKTLDPTELGPNADSFEYRVISPCDTVITIPVTAEVYARVEISTTKEIETEIGAEETISVYLKAEADLGEQTYTITTGIDQSVLYTEDNFTVNQTAPINKAKTKVHEINGTIMLASSLEYDITFPSYNFNNQYIEVNTEQGKLTIDSVCAFPMRSVTITEATEMKISPNPAKDKLTIDVTTDVSATLNVPEMKLELISSEGRVAYTKNWTQTNSEKQLNINTDKIPSGLYQVRLQTPSGVLTENVIVVR